jgi:2-iminobutanoate/2-iminopropanoate deaminase
MPHARQIVATDSAPQAIGPYSQAQRFGPFVYTAGQVAIDPATGAIVPGGIEAETRQVWANLAAVLAAAGSSVGQIIKTTVYMTDLSEFAQMNAIYAQMFSGNFPARSTVQVAALPKGGRVEIEVIAVTE